MKEWLKSGFFSSSLLTVTGLFFVSDTGVQGSLELKLIFRALKDLSNSSRLIFHNNIIQ